jgi:hypothetical protein
MLPRRVAPDRAMRARHRAGNQSRCNARPGPEQKRSADSSVFVCLSSSSKHARVSKDTCFRASRRRPRVPRGTRSALNSGLSPGPRETCSSPIARPAPHTAPIGVSARSESPGLPRKQEPVLARFQQTPPAAPDDRENHGAHVAPASARLSRSPWKFGDDDSVVDG